MIDLAHKIVETKVGGRILSSYSKFIVVYGEATASGLFSWESSSPENTHVITQLYTSPWSG